MANVRPPLSIVRHFILPETIATLLVAFFPSPVWRFSGVIVASYLCFTALFSTTGDGVQDYTLGSAFAMETMTTIGIIWLINPIYDYRHEKDTVPPNEQRWQQRIYWAFSLRRNPRGIGWNYQVSYLYSHCFDIRPTCCPGLECPNTTNLSALVLCPTIPRPISLPLSSRGCHRDIPLVLPPLLTSRCTFTHNSTWGTDFGRN